MGKNLEESPQSPPQPECNLNLPKLSRRSKIPVRIPKNSAGGRKTLVDKKQRSTWGNVEYENNLSNFLGTVQRESVELKALREALLVLADPILEAPEGFRSKTNRSDDGGCNKCDFNGFKVEGETEQDRAERDRENATETDTETVVEADSQERRENELKLDEETMKVPSRIASASELYYEEGEGLDAPPGEEVGSPTRRCTTPTLLDNESPHETEAITRLEVDLNRDDVREEEEEMKVTSAVLADMDDERTQVRVPESIVKGVAAPCATTPGCSRVSDAPACATRPEDDTAGESGECATSGEIVQVIARIGELASRDEIDLQIDRDQLRKLKSDIELITRTNACLSSKEINKRTGDNRLKYLEEKLKAAGITDGVEQVVDKLDYDDNQNLVREVFSCEFDVNKLGDYDQGEEGCYLVYDELDDDCMKTRDEMGTDSDRKQHNPDRENLKSLLKKPGRGKDRKNRVVFNENRNEFFDADYIILIREDCEYDDEDDDGVCTCNQHEMVRLTCCEPGCNCNIYEGFDPTPQSPKFAPPLEFVDAVTLSPPEGYKDMELGEQQLYALQQMARKGQMAAVCRECSQTHDPEGEASDEEPFSDQEGGREKTDQSQQTTPTTPPADTEMECEERRPRSEPPTVAVATSNERKLPKDMDDERMELRGSPIPTMPPGGGGSPINGILKGGRLWKQQSVEVSKPIEPQQVSDASITSDDENGSKRSVRFTEADEKRAVCDGAPEKNTPEEQIQIPSTKDSSVSPEPTEMMLTFKLGHHVLISNNSLKPNSAVRQLFPCAKPLVIKPGEEDTSNQFLVTSESLRAFEDSKKSKLSHITSTEADESIRRAIERNTLRRSLIRYEPRSKKNLQKTDNSLVERIKQLTCDVDEPLPEEEQARASPPGEEARNSPDTNIKNDKSFSPSSSSSSNSSVSSTYKKITDIFAKKDRPDIQAVEAKMQHPPPDLGGPQNEHESIGKIGNSMNENKKFLSTLAPLTACVGGNMRPDDYYYNSNNPGERVSMASSVGTEYSLEDIEEGLRKEEEETKMIAPDVLAGTPSASESGDELAMFVQQDASRIERIKKKYQADDEDDEHDDYGFNRRPSVRGIKPRFGSTTEILQQIQNQMQPPNNTPPRNPPPIAWPYYSETNLSGVDNKRNINQPPNYQYAQSYRPTTLMDENVYQNCTLQRCAQGPYRANVNLYTASPVVRVGGGCNEYYQSLPRMRGNGRPQSPPPQEVSKGYHQTMVYIPYNHIEGAYYDQNYVRVTNQNQINKRFVDPNYQEQYAKARANYNVLCMDAGRSESPLPGQFSTARSTQTPAPSLSSCTYYPRYRAPPPNGAVWSDGVYAQKINRHSFPSGVMRYPNSDNISLTDSESQHSGHLPNGYRESMPNSPTKPRFIERGVPEGAASVSPQDSNATSTSTVTSPTSPQIPQMNPKPLFYAMNV